MTLTRGSNCTLYGATACYPSTATQSCDDACQSTAVVCNDPNYPECFTAMANDNSHYNHSITAVWCDVVSSSVEVFQNWFWSYSTSLPYNYSSTLPTGPLSQTPGSTLPFPTQQQTAGASAAGAQATETSSAGSIRIARYATLAISILTTVLYAC